MKQFLPTATIAMVFVAATVLAGSAFAQQKYIGSPTCKACHNTDKAGKQYSKWEASAHAKAFKTLQSAEADAIAAKAGHKTKAAETPECLTCHVTGKDQKSPVYDAKFANSEGVGCESCHGPGSGYRTLHIKKENLKKAEEAGMLFPKVADGSAEKQCKTCHNKKSPTYREFKFAELWKQIAHPKP